MSYVAVEFGEKGNNVVALAHESWLSKGKSEVFWPSYSTSDDDYSAALITGKEPKHNWQIFSIQQVIFECDNFQEAAKKLTQLKLGSDVQTFEPVKSRKRRQEPVKNGSFSGSAGQEAPAKAIKTTQSEPSSISFSVNTDFEKQVLTYLHTIKEQNVQILKLLRSCETKNNAQTPMVFPVCLPLNNHTDLNEFEEYLQDSDNLFKTWSHFASIGGKDPIKFTNNILKKLLTNEFAVFFNFRGNGGKLPFANLKLRQIVIEAVKIGFPTTTDQVIEGAIKTWLKHAPQRHQNEFKKRQSFIKVESV